MDFPIFWYNKHKYKKEDLFMIKVEGIKCEYNNGTYKQLLFDDVAFSIDDGEFVIITGTSGSGKTSLLKILSGMQKPNSGKVLWDDVDIYSLNANDLSDLKLGQSGFIYQDFMLIDELNAYDNIILPAKLHNTFDKKYIDNLIEKFNISSLLKKYPKVLSGGEKQRVAIVRSLVNRPRVLFCDEPTGSLDYKATIEIMEFLKSLNYEFGITIILVTHEMENLKYAKRLIKYENGVLKCD